MTGTDIQIDQVKHLRLTFRFVVISWIVFLILAPIIAYAFEIPSFWSVFWPGFTCTSIIAPLVSWVAVRNTLRAEAISKQLAESTEALIAARDEAEKATAAKAEFLAVMSHEIRTPLNGMLGMAQVLSNRPLPPQDHDLAARMQSSGEMLLSILNDILDISKIEAGEMAMEEAPTDLRALSDDLSALFAPVAERKGVTLSFELSETLPKRVLTDPVRLSQCVSNLVSNAVKFTNAGGVTVRITHEQGPDHKATIMVDVHDTGIGMSEDAQRSIFQPFTQADGSITRRFGGTGLGLSISRRLAIAMGGGVSIVASKPYAGTHIRLTIAAATLEAEAPLAAADSHARRADLYKGLSVLVVDDTTTNRLILRHMLARVGAEVTEAASGEEALDHLRRSPFGVVLLDMQMPGLSGPETLAEIRKEHGPKAPPIIAVTAEAMLGDRERLLGLGMTGYVSKPVLAPTLMAELQRCLTTHARSSAEVGAQG